MYLKHLEKLAIPSFSRSFLFIHILSFTVLFVCTILLPVSFQKLIAQNHPNGIDFIGPDGLTYPDFTHAGIEGGIPNIQNVVARVERNTGNDRQAFMNAIQTAENAGGGVVFVPNGTYNLSDHVMVRSSNIVIRGESRDGVMINLNNNTEEDGAAIYFKGNFGFSSTPMSADLRRGETRVYVQNISMFEGASLVFLRRNDAPDFHEGNNNQNPGVYALQVVKVKRIGSNYIDFELPAREDYLTSQGSKVYRVDPIRRVGIENLSIRHPNEINGKRSHGVNFYFTYEFWAKNVAFYDITNHYIDYNLAKNGEIRDCYFEGSPNRTEGGGNAYVGFWHATDCLMENVRTKDTRHIAFQIFASGNVIRKSYFENAGDLNYHNLFPGHNLFEQNYLNDFNNTGGRTVVSWGVVTIPTTSGQHTPVGLNNVIYNNHFDTKEFGGGLHLGGLERNLLYVYNLMEFKGDGWYNRPYGNRAEPAIGFGNESRNTLIKGNTFSLIPGGEKNTWAVARMGTYSSSTYDEYIMEDNKFYGFRSDRQVKEQPNTFTNNQFLPETNSPDAPQPPVPSIYEWQLSLTGGSNTFPVELVDFYLELGELDIELKWQTGTELNSSHFEIERSLDDRIFTRIGEVAATGSENTSTNYSFSDNEAVRNRKYYYRLKMVDLDGSFEYSQTLEGRLENVTGLEMTLFPNPAKDVINLDLKLLEAMPYQIRVSDARGIEVMFSQYGEAEGRKMHELDISSLPPGIYHVSVAGEYKVLGKSFIKF